MFYGYKKTTSAVYYKKHLFYDKMYWTECYWKLLKFSMWNFDFKYSQQTGTSKSIDIEHFKGAVDLNLKSMSKELVQLAQDNLVKNNFKFSWTRKSIPDYFGNN